MKMSKEFLNGFLIFVGIGIYFLLMEFSGLSNLYYLRFFNILFVFYGVDRTLKSNFKEGKLLISENAISALYTALVGVFLSVIGLISYSYLQGGDQFVESLSKNFLYGGDPSIMTYSISMLFEGIVSAVIVTFILMLIWDGHYVSNKRNN